MKKIENTLIHFGITRRYKCCSRTVYAIHLSIREEERLWAVTKEIYKETASHFGCSYASVEHNIRTAVARAWKNNPTLLSEMAGYPLTTEPTASEFLEIISYYISRSDSAEP